MSNVVLLAARVKDVKVPHVPDCTKMRCMDCTALVWVTPASLRHACELAKKSGRKVKARCNQCAEKAATISVMPNSAAMTNEINKAR